MAIGKVTDWWLGTDGKLHTYLSGSTITPPGPPLPPAPPSVTAKIVSQSALTVNVSATVTVPAGNTVASVTWVWGDGTQSAGSVLTHTYTAAGTYNISVTATDNLGQTGKATINATVTVPVNQPPVASFTTFLPDGTDPQTVGFTSTSTDPDGTIAAWAWDFGDGGAGTGYQLSHRYNGSGSFTVKLTVTDNSGAKTTTSRAVTVNAKPVPPVIAFALTTSGAVASYSFAGTTTPAGDTLVTSVNWGDGSSTNPAGVSGTHTYTAVGPFTVTATALDTTTGLSDTTTAQSAPVIQSSGGGSTGTNGDPGVNRTGTAGKQQTGATDYATLAGSTMQAKVSAAGTTGVSFGAGTFSMSDFSGSGTSGVGVNWPSGVKAVLGAGSASTTVQMPANLDTSHSNISGNTTAVFMHSFTSPADGFVMDGIKFVGTPQQSGNLLYHLMQIGSLGNGTISNCTFLGGRGTGGSPPQETFQMSLWHQPAGKTTLVKNCTFDGQNTTAANAATNGAQYGTTTFQDCLFENAANSAGLALWLQMSGSVVNLIRPVFKNNHRNLGNEAQGGDINIYDPMFAKPTTASEDDIRITWTADANSGKINIYFTTMKNLTDMMSARGGAKLTSQVAAKNATMYGGSHPAYSGPNDPQDFCHIFVAGVEIDKTPYWTVPRGK